MAYIATRHEFDAWWAQYPLKRGKVAAEKKYHAARRRGVTQAALLTGLAAYVQHKPAWQEWAFPSTWLHQGRYDDDYSQPAPSEPPTKRVAPAYRPYVPWSQRNHAAGD